jgi:CheY-like chemotaxis protein/HPt (histidine-containing phosphotransfer) domain-containing protein
MARVQDGDVTMETSDETGTMLTVTLRAAPEGAMPATARHAADRRGVEPSLISALPPTRVLLVDDDEYNLLIVRRFLPAPPFTVDTAINGRVALAAAQAHWPDLVFMDLDMPVMGGLQAVSELRALQRARDGVPCRIVALSSHDDEETRRVALAAGFDHYLTKPVTREVIQEALFALCGPAAAVPLPDAAREGAAGRDEPIVVDADVQPVLAQFIASRRDLIAGMASAIGAADRGEVRRIAHQLAGSFGLYGFTWASQQTRWIERNCALADAGRLQAMTRELRTHLDTAQLRTVHGAIIEAIVEPDRGDSP